MILLTAFLIVCVLFFVYVLSVCGYENSVVNL